MSNPTGYVELPSALVIQKATEYLENRKVNLDIFREKIIDSAMLPRNWFDRVMLGKPNFTTRDKARAWLEENDFHYKTVDWSGGAWADRARALIKAAGLADTVLVDVSVASVIIGDR